LHLGAEVLTHGDRRFELASAAKQPSDEP